MEHEAVVLGFEGFVTAWTHGVVNPNMVSPMRRACGADSAGRGNAIMPASACAALESTCSEMRLMPGHVGHRIHHADVGGPT